MKLPLFALAAAALGLAAFTAPKPATAPGTVYDYTVKTIDGKELKLSDFKGKKLLIVNTASHCGFTPQYEELEKLSKQYAGKVTVLGFPSNSFNQELPSDSEVASFCQKNFGVTFPLFATAAVKGDDAQPLYKYLASAAGEAPSWNFCKYLVDEQGHVVKFYPSKVKPLSPELVADIEKK